MMKKNKKTFDVTKFESLQTTGNELKGGFSTAYMGGNGKLDEIIKANIGDCSTSNTCNTGNCIVDLNLSFTTNGLLINDDFINYFINNNLTISLQITFDGYKEQHDKVRFLNMKKGSYDTIVTNINKLLQFDNFHVTARINYTDENIHDCFKISNDFQAITIQTEFHNK